MGDIIDCIIWIETFLRITINLGLLRYEHGCTLSAHFLSNSSVFGRNAVTFGRPRRKNNNDL